MSRTVRAVAVLALVGALVVGVPLSASAATTPPGFDPSSSKWRQYMLTVTGKVLGSAMPSKWKAEQIANEYALRYSPDALAAATGIGRGGSLDKIPETIEDYTTQAYERQIQNGTVAKKTKGAVPATRAGSLVKGAAGVGSAVVGLQMGFQFGSGVASLFGLDSAGAVCSGTPENGAVLTQFFTGVDCSAWTLDEGYVANADAGTSFSAGPYTVTVTQKLFEAPGDANKKYYALACAGGPKAPGSGYLSVSWRMPTGAVTAYATLGHIASGASECPLVPGYAGYAAGTAAQGTWPVLVGVRYSDGSTVTQADPVQGDPERVLDCVVTYTDGSTDVGTSDPYRESQGSIAPISCPPADPGKVVDSVAVNERGSGTTNTLYESDTTDEYQDYAERFEQCGEQLCLLDLVTNKYPGSVVSCFDLDDGCADWWEDPNKTSNYECVYGSEVVDLDECAVYAGLFTPGRVEIGAPYSDPMTGDWSGATNSLKPDQQAMTQTVQDPDARMRECTGMAITGFDPVGFVMRPVQCALEWAFVPRPAVVGASVAAADLEWDSKPIGQIQRAMGALSPSASGCSKSVTIFEGDFESTVPVIDACPGSWLADAGIPTISRIVTGAGVLIMVLVVLRRQIAGMAGYTSGQG